MNPSTIRTTQAGGPTGLSASDGVAEWPDARAAPDDAALRAAPDDAALRAAPDDAALRAARAVVGRAGARGGRLERERAADSRWTFALRYGATARPRYALRVTRVPDAGRTRGPAGRSVGRLLAEASSEADWLTALARDGRLPAPHPVRAPNDPFPGGAAYAIDGETLGDAGSVYVVLCTHWVRWRRVWRPDARGAAARVGRAVGALHDCAARFAPPPRFVRPRYDVEGRVAADAAVAERLALHPGLGTDVLDAVRSTAARAQTAARAADGAVGGVGLIHGALDSEHIILARDLGAADLGGVGSAGAQVGVVDFGVCGWGPFLFDLAGALRAFDAVDGAARDDLRAAFLDAYVGVHDVPAEAETQLADFAGAWDLHELATAVRTDAVPGVSYARVHDLLNRLRERLG